MVITTTDVQEKEHLIQTRQRHYSEMISQEHAPSDTHKSLYQLALAQTVPVWRAMCRRWPRP